MRVYLTDEKHGDQIFASCLAIVRTRINTTYCYEDEHIFLRAEEIVASGNEAHAKRFLDERDDYEYEGFRSVEVIE